MRLLALVTALLTIPVSAAWHEPVRARNGMIVTVDRYASEIGVRVLERGGNAVDAAVAVSYALAVTWPSAGNLGGGGFMLIRLADGTVAVIDYREIAPAAATADMYLDDDGNVIENASIVGHLGAGVPGTVAGLQLALETYGTMELSELIEPAIELAEEGFTISPSYVRQLEDPKPRARLEAFEESRRVFLNEGQSYEIGDRFVQPDLAATLQRIAAEGSREFYEGETAELIVAEMERGGGIITLEDLASYQPVIREPLRGTYRGYEILTMPPPSSGGATLLQMLNILEGFDLSGAVRDSAGYVHSLAEVMKLAFADRAEYMGDTDFVEVPIAALTAKEYAEEQRKRMNFERPTPSSEIRPGLELLSEPDSTTHFSIVDAEGNAVSVTTTLNGTFGSGATVTGAGFLLNNEMDDFTSKPGVPNLYGLIQGDANAIEPGKKPLSSMTPTIVVKDGNPFLVTGSPGGPRIITAVLQVILNVIDHGMDVQAAVAVPRVHHQWLPDHLKVEPDTLSLDSRRVLEALGYEIEIPEGVDAWHGSTNTILVDPETGVRLGAPDPRRGAHAAGY